MSENQSLITNLFPDLAPDDYDEALYALRHYLSFIVRLHTRITADPREHDRLSALTREACTSSMEEGRSFTSQTQGTDI